MPTYLEALEPLTVQGQLRLHNSRAFCHAQRKLFLLLSLLIHAFQGYVLENCNTNFGF